MSDSGAKSDSAPFVFSWRVLHEGDDLLLSVTHVLEDGSTALTHVIAAHHTAWGFTAAWDFTEVDGTELSDLDMDELAEDLDRYLGYSHENPRYMER